MPDTGAGMHLYNAWLPPPVVEGIRDEDDSLGEIAENLKRSWNPEDPKSKFATLKWISLINNLIRAKTRPGKDALESVATLGFDVFFHSSENLFVQVRWASCLSKILSKHHKDLTLELDWRKLYEMMLTIHFKRRHFFEGIALRQIHLESLVVLIANSRRFFRAGSASEIWAEFRPYLDNGIHNSALEAVGFLSLFLPTNLTAADADILTSDWFSECLRLWDGISDCPYWDRQWACLLARFVKHRAYASRIDWGPFLPLLFGHFLNMFEVPVAKADALPPIEREVPYDLRLAFNGHWTPSPKSVAKAIVYMLEPDNCAQARFEQLVDLLEQYYHPSNGGSWTSSLEQFLRYLSYFFIKRLAYEQEHSSQSSCLGPNEREAFVKTIVRLIERGQYSKSGRLAVTSSNVASGLSFVAPSVMLPFIVSQFETAMTTVTATHQLESALTTLALSSRAILLAGNIDTDIQMESDTSDRLDFSFNLSFVDCKATLVEALFSTLLGMDANDPPKTLATIQFYASVVANVGNIGEVTDGGSSVLPIDWSQWLDEFLSRLFVLLRHAESGTHTGDINLGEGSHKSTSTFLMQENSLYSVLVELLFGRLTKPLFQQALKKVAKFVLSNILPGAVTEMGLLCSALVFANPADTVPQVLLPVMEDVLRTLTEAENVGSAPSSSATKLNLSPATENSVSTQLTLLSYGMMNAGPALLQCENVLKRIIAACFKFNSVKVNEAGERLLTSTVESLVLYYPLQQYRSFTACPSPGYDGIEAWIGTKEPLPPAAAPIWHIPSENEIAFAEELMRLHLQDALADLRNLCETNSVTNKEKLRILLLRICGSLKGARSALPDFSGGNGTNPVRISGNIGASVGSSKLREEAADTLIKACEYLLKAKADDTSLLVLLVQSLDFVGNYGSSEYGEWSNGKRTWRSDAKILVEPRINFITGAHSLGKRRPYWMMTEMVYLHNIWRASQAGYRQFEGNELNPYVVKVSMELLKLSLHNYDEVRDYAGSSLKKLLKRFPPLVKACMPTLATSLQDSDALEHAALGACVILASRPVLRHIAQDWKSLATFIQAVLGSSRHSSVKAQTAISELAIAFSVRFGGVPLSALSAESSDAAPSYAGLISFVKDSSDGTTAVHWRYKLMAYVGMLCLVLPLNDSNHRAQIMETRKFLAGEFLNGLGSDLPSVRPLSVIALLLLLHSSHHKTDKQTANFSVEDGLTPVLQRPAFASQMVKNLSLDHHYSEGHGRSRGSRVQTADLSVVAMMPAFVRQWPATRNWVLVSKGEEFSPKLAKLFKRLVQECGPVALEALRAPLQAAVDATDERTMQCMAAEILAGLLHSDVSCVVEAWKDWLCDLFHKALMQANPESLAEWAACVRFSSTGKGKKGLKAPVLRQSMLETLMTRRVSSSASTSLVSKRIQYLLSLVMELRPEATTEGEIDVQRELLVEVLGLMANPSSQVRQHVGKIMCVLCTNLQDASSSMFLHGKEIPDWETSLFNGTNTATAKIQNALEATEAGDTSSSSSDSDVQEAIKYMETIFQFLIASMASGRAAKLMPVLVGALPSALALLETSHKDMALLAKLAVYLYKWQPFSNEYRAKAVEAITLAATDSNWRTRLSALTFSQSFAFRHAFTLEKGEFLHLWNCVQNLLSDSQLEVRELASTTLSGMLKGPVSDLPEIFRTGILSSSLKNAKPKTNRSKASDDKVFKHGIVMGLRACILSAPYDIPRWLPDMIVALAKFTHEPSPISTTVRKTIAEFRRTHADTWAYQKNYFSEEQLEVLADLTSSASYFA